MADPQSNARLRASAGAPTSGVIHVRTRLTADFTVISNALAQRRGSAVTVGVAAYILSLPDGAPVTIAALCEHFSEGEILISRALRELEEAGYLERRRERLSSGRIRTRTCFYDVPGGDGDGDGDGTGGPVGSGDPDGADGADVPPEPPKPPRPRRRPTGGDAPLPAAPAPTPLPAPDTRQQAEEPAPLADADPQAVAVLSTLRRVDPRLVLSAREAARLAPAVSEWLAAGIGAREITELLTTRLPDRFRARPAGILAFRLRETPLPEPADSTEPLVPPAAVSMRNCDGCERGFRSAEHDRCRDCRSRAELPAAG
ncbi:hypothetical protein [Streptomyces sp. NRRL F-5135]|uniref:hypothetical protein n=1 Tax=Streptomyces sp. NRRL F-5135 TaxID=1463858 RepID=UPI0004C660E1|nr:hypothetical protein [Streptomyces sp. NRRL F-5135]